MNWSDVVTPPKPSVVRQFAGLCLVFAAGWAAWRAWNGQLGAGAAALALVGAAIGVVGLVRPAAIRPIYTGWMIAVFPIGWTVSQLLLGLMFYTVFAPVGLLFRMIGRDGLSLRRREARSYWTNKDTPTSVSDYFRQS